MDITIAGNNYKTTKLDAFKQFHVSRRLAPALWALAGAASSDKGGDDSALMALEPVARAVSQMSDEDSEYVLKACLSVCNREQNGGWAKVMNGNGQMMFQDIDMPAMMQLTFAVIQDNLGNFMQGLTTPA